MMTHPSKAKGDKFERLIAATLAEDGHPVERIPAGASDDRGDLWIAGLPVTTQCKNRATLALPEWWRDTERQRLYNGHEFGFLVHNRPRVAAGLDQWVTVDVATFSRILHALRGRP